MDYRWLKGIEQSLAQGFGLSRGDVEDVVAALREAWTKIGDLERQLDTAHECLQEALLVAKAQQ